MDAARFPVNAEPLEGGRYPYRLKYTIMEVITQALSESWLDAVSAPLLDALLACRDDRGIPEIVNLLMEQVGGIYKPRGRLGWAWTSEDTDELLALVQPQPTNFTPVFRLRPEHRGEQR